MKHSLAAHRLHALAPALLVTAVLGTVMLGGATAHAQFQSRTIRVSNGINQEHPVGNGIAKMTQCLAEKSGGKIKLQAFWGNALGGDMQATSALRGGTLEMVITSSSPLVGMFRELGVFDLPFLFNNEKEADAVLDGPFGKYMTTKLPCRRAWSTSPGGRTVSAISPTRASRSRSASDMSGLKVRVMQNNIFLDSFKTLGANAMPMAFGEVFTALETQGDRRAGKPDRHHRHLEDVRSAEVPRTHEACLHAVPGALLQEALGHAVGRRAEGLVDCAIVGRDEQRKVSRELSDKSLGEAQEEGHAGHRD